MENNNQNFEQMEANVNKDIDEMLQEGKDLETIEKEIKAKYAEVKPAKVSSVYDSKAELLKLIDKVDKLKEKLPADKAKINRDLKDEVIKKKEAELELMYNADIRNIREELGRIEAKHNKYFQEGVKRLQIGAEYKEAKQNAFNILLAIGFKLEADLIAELLEPLIAARDLTAIRILEKTASPDNRIAYRQARRQVEEFNAVNEISEAIREIDRYLNKPSTTKHLSLQLALDRFKRGL